MDRAARAARLLRGDVRKAGVGTLHRLLIAGGRPRRFVEGPHAAVGPGIALKVAGGRARHLEVLGAREPVFRRLHQHLERVAIVLALLSAGRATNAQNTYGREHRLDQNPLHLARFSTGER